MRFWENRAESAPDGECAHAPKEDVDERGPIRKVAKALFPMSKGEAD